MQNGEFKKQSGQILLLTLVALGVVLFTVLFIIGGAQVYFQNAQYSLDAEKALALAEAGVDKAVVSLNQEAGSYNGEDETLFGDGSYSIIIANKSSNIKQIQSTGYIPNKLSPKVKRTITTQVSTGTGISFVYGMLVGEGGISLGNESVVNGSIYSNGNIVGGNNVTITGDAYVAGGTQASADQQNDCFDSNCQNYIFGKNVNGENRQFVAQSFKPASSGVINKVSLKLQRVGSPANLTVRVMANNNGVPDKNNILASGVLSTSLIGQTQPEFVDATFSSAPSLTSETTYWIMLAAQSLNSSNYFIWSSDLAQQYTRGLASWSVDWQTKNPVWASVQADLGFKTWMGGVSTSISMNNGSVAQGNVHANTINGLIINKDAYYQVITNSTVLGQSYPNSADPAPEAMPISSSNIEEWQSQAEGYGVTTGDLSGCPSRVGPGKFIGNFTTDSNCANAINVITPVWITGNLTVGNSVTFKMDASLGSSSGVIIVDGRTLFGNGDDLLGTGEEGSYLTLLSTYDSRSTGIPAIDTGNSSITGILYAPFGIISLANNADFKEAVAWKINTGTRTILSYDSGLISTVFSAGPSGSFSLVKGTYQVK